MQGNGNRSLLGKEENCLWCQWLRKAGELIWKEINRTTAFLLPAIVSSQRKTGSFMMWPENQSYLLLQVCYGMEPCIPLGCSTTGLSEESPWLSYSFMKWSPCFYLQAAVWEHEIKFISSSRWRTKDSSRFVCGVLLSLLNGDLKSIIIKGKQAKVSDSWDFGEGGEEAGISLHFFLLS